MHDRSLFLRLTIPALGAAVALALCVPQAHSAPQHESHASIDADDMEAAGKIYRASCMTCHLPPDPDHFTDRAWLNQVKDTAWSNTPKKARAALIDYLTAKPLELPIAVEETKPMRKGEGTVSSNIFTGDLFLVDRKGKAFRLSWAGPVKDKLEPRAIPAGQYVLRTYRIMKEQAGKTWHVSATAPTIQKIKVVAGENVHVKVNQHISVSSKMKGKRGTMNIAGAPRVGLSIYRDQKRIPMGYRVIDVGGKELAKGSMRYGWGGGGWTQLESFDQAVRFELVYDKPPFKILKG